MARVCLRGHRIGRTGVWEGEAPAEPRGGRRIYREGAKRPSSWEGEAPAEPRWAKTSGHDHPRHAGSPAARPPTLASSGVTAGTRKTRAPVSGGLSPCLGGSRSGEGEEQQNGGNHAHPDLAFHPKTCLMLRSGRPFQRTPGTNHRVSACYFDPSVQAPLDRSDRPAVAGPRWPIGIGSPAYEEEQAVGLVGG